ncbi:MAG: histidine--tRNA ligase [Clostridia bacterium]|nr:histidine--tRNA ligase [Clostridia bacterium]
MKITPVKGTTDFLPKEAELRDYMQQQIISTYKNYGFNRIYTPILEDIENLEKSDGGDNLSLIYKVLKRGDKFVKSIENKDFDNLADLGLRYDLTLPLSRFYSCHKAELPSPFKCIQVDRVFRAERPQKGRSRELVQCDIDILGSNSCNCEIELIDVTAQALLNIGLSNFKIRINDRQLLRKTLVSLGFSLFDLDSVCITFDKLDKIGAQGVKEELLAKQFDVAACQNLYDFVENKPSKLEDIKSYVGDMPEYINLSNIIDGVKKLAKGKYGIVFDISLVRGQGYYTGAVFEIQSDDFFCSIGGGGRYDNLVGKFTGESIPAVGFSIGFERIYSILNDKGFKLPQKKNKLAIIYKDNDFVQAMEYAKSVSYQYDFCLFEMPNKLGKFLNRLCEQDFTNYVVFGENSNEIKDLVKF